MKDNQLAADSTKPAFLSHDPALPHSVWLERDPMKGFGGWSLYTSGFKMAADELVAHLGEESTAPHLPHFAVYPIAFLYRQYLELRLKQMLWSMGGAIPKKHELMTLWDRVRERFKYYAPQDEQFLRKYDRVADLLRPIDELDPRSEGFRYPYNQDGQLTIDEDVKGINLQRLKEHVAAIAGLLDEVRQ